VIVVNELKQLYGGFKNRIITANAEDTILTLLAIGMVIYLKNIVQNWEHPEIVRFDIEVLAWLFAWYLGILLFKEARLFLQERGTLTNAKFLVELNKFKIELATLMQQAGLTKLD